MRAWILPLSTERLRKLRTRVLLITTRKETTLLFYNELNDPFQARGMYAMETSKDTVSISHSVVYFSSFITPASTSPI
jgi:hypothetical protein